MKIVAVLRTVHQSPLEPSEREAADFASERVCGKIKVPSG